MPLTCDEGPPIGRHFEVVLLKTRPAADLLLLIEVFVDSGVDSNEFLQNSHAPEA